MNVNTGKIVEMTEKEMLKALRDKAQDLIPINLADLTARQRREMQVSKKDNRSKMGKVFSNFRAEQKEIIKREREFKNKNKCKKED